MAYVNFGRKNTRQEALNSTNLDKVFFPTDASSIIMGGKEYGIGASYSNGNGIDITDNSISLKLSEDEETQYFLSLTSDGLKLTGILDNEEVVANSLNRLNTSLGFDEKGYYIPSISSHYIGNVETVYDALDTLDSALYEGLSNIDVSHKQDKLIYYSEDTTNHELEISTGANAYIIADNNSISIMSDTDDVTNGLSISNSGVTLAATNDDSPSTVKMITMTNGYGYYGTYGDTTETTEIATVGDVKNVDDKLEDINDIIKDNEEVISTTFNKTKKSLGFDEHMNYTPSTSAQYISSASTITDALNILDRSIPDTSSFLTSSNVKTVNGESIVGKGDIVVGSSLELADDEETNMFLKVTDDKLSITGILSNERVTAKALNRINSSVGLSEDGRYSASADAYYISDSYDIAEALDILDDSLHTVSVDLNKKIGDIDNALLIILGDE